MTSSIRAFPSLGQSWICRAFRSSFLSSFSFRVQHVQPMGSDAEDRIAAVHVRRGARGTDRVILSLGCMIVVWKSLRA